MKEKIYLLTGLRFQMLSTIAILLSISACHRDPTPVIPPSTISCDEIAADVVWANRNDSIDYIVDCILTVNAKLTIEPGVTIQFNHGAGVIISNTGALNAVGTLQKPIVLKGTADSVGVWKGLFFSSGSSSAANELKYCTITNGGSESFDGHADYVANIRVALSAALKISNTEVLKSGKDGLFTEGFDDADLNPIAFFADNYFAGNVGFPISTTAPTVNALDGLGSTYVIAPGVHSRYINVRGGRMFGNHTWKRCSVAYDVSADVIAGYYTNEGNLTVEPGVKIYFRDSCGIAVGEYSSGFISMVSTPASYIILSPSYFNSSLYWKGICFNSTNVNNRLSYVTINNGGSSSFTGNTSHLANISIGGYSAGYAQIENTSVTDSKGYGIFVASGSTQPMITNVNYSANTLDDYYVEP